MSALHRGRTTLRELANEPEDVKPPDLSPTERTSVTRITDFLYAPYAFDGAEITLGR
jgi:hypothetical protein